MVFSSQLVDPWEIWMKFEMSNFHVNFCNLWLRCLLWKSPSSFSPNLTDGKSTLVQVFAWCPQAASHYLSQCWPRSLSPHGVIRPCWIKMSDTNVIACISQHWDTNSHIISWTEFSMGSFDTSHECCIFQAKFSKDSPSEMHSKIHLVDLAGRSVMITIKFDFCIFDSI